MWVGWREVGWLNRSLPVQAPLATPWLFVGLLILPTQTGEGLETLRHEGSCDAQRGPFLQVGYVLKGVSQNTNGIGYIKQGVLEMGERSIAG